MILVAHPHIETKEPTVADSDKKKSGAKYEPPLADPDGAAQEKAPLEGATKPAAPDKAE